MAVYREDIADIELESGTVFRSFLNSAVGEGNAKANRYGVRLFRNGEAENLTGIAVSGYFIRADGTSVSLTGDKSGNKAWVELPEACYAVEGNFTLSIILYGGGTSVTARIVDGTVVDTVVGTLVDPGSVIPDVSGLTELVERAEAAAETIEAFDITETQITGTRYKIEVTTVE